MGRTGLALSLLLLSISFSASGFAVEPTSSTTTLPPPSPLEAKIKMHERLADLHQRAADCLKSGRTAEECRKQMMMECPIGEIDECKTIDTAELRKHSRTHERAGTVGKESPAEPDYIPNSKKEK